MSTNVERYCATHEAFNRRDFESMIEHMAPAMKFVDPARGVTTTGPDEFVSLCKQEIQAASDARVENAQYFDAGQAVVGRFMTCGTHDGDMAGIPATGKTYAVPVLEIAHFDEHDKMSLVEIFYDLRSLLDQLGISLVPASA